MTKGEGGSSRRGRTLDRWMAVPRRLALRVPLRFRVVAMVALIQLGLFGLGGYAMLNNARQSTREEIQSSLLLARRYAIATVATLVQGSEREQVLRHLPSHLQQPRHVRLHVIDSTGNKVVPTAVMADHAGKESGAVPAWFAALIAVPTEWAELPIMVDGRRYGTIVITTEPQDEIAEVWADLTALLPILIATYLLLLAALYLAVVRALRPLAEIGGALAALEAGNYRVRVSEALSPDLLPIARGCNALASGLERAVAEKDRLNRQMVTLQDSERKHIAMELHDEFGPCLFGIKVEASSLAKAALGLPNGTGMAERARSILEIADLMQESNRSLLRRLRPMAIGQLPLHQVLDDLIRGLAARRPEVDFEVEIDSSIEQASETTALTIYRVVQEAITNALRHADPRRLEVSVTRRAVPEKGDGPKVFWYTVRVADDGRGMRQDHPTGAGIHGMRERVASLAGELDIRPGAGGGTVITARLPEPEAMRSALPELDAIAA